MTMLIATPPPPPPTGFFDSFTPDVIEQLVEALVTACDSAAEFHDEALGSNSTTFGFNLYHFSTHEIANRADGSQLVIASRFPLFRATVGNHFELGCYKVGDASGDDIWASFPNNENGAPGMVQPYLPGFEPNVSNATKVVLAYMANPEEGLCAAYLCIATLCVDNRIAEWGFVHQIFSRSAMRDALAVNAARHADETIEDAEITRDASEEDNGTRKR